MSLDSTKHFVCSKHCHYCCGCTSLLSLRQNSFWRWLPTGTIIIIVIVGGAEKTK